MLCGSAFAQRHTDQLGRGLVVIPTGASGNSSANLITWRRLADEYYDVTYNLYKDGTLLKNGLTTTSYSDASKAYTTSRYQVEAVVRGTVQPKCAAVTAWNQYVYKLGDTRTPTGYLDIALATVYDRDGKDVTANYSPNDAEMADLDGDGELEIIIKRLSTYDAGSKYVVDNGEKKDTLSKELYAADSRQFVVIDAYDVNWQTGAAELLWRIDCGPNMVSLNSTEIDVIAYDWDEDGKAEVVLRGADDMVVYGSDGQTKKYTVGIAGFNSRTWINSHSDSQYAWTRVGREYFIYMNGLTGDAYEISDFPLPRIEEAEWATLTGTTAAYNDYAQLLADGGGNYFTQNTGVLAKAWGDNYGHRSTKYFFGAPVLDGRKASLFMGRGIYTRHKMIAMDLDKGSHKWTTRWRWNCNDSNSPWYGNGYHNFIIADVDEDGRDEIVYGSMVIDDNGKGLSTSGYEHGDAQHVGDFNPYRKGLEFFGCLEDGPYYGCDYRDATTSEVLYKYTGTGDDGRGIMANFTDKYIGSQGRSVGSPIISSITGQQVMDTPESNGAALYWSHLNARIYWDGDLCSEMLDSPGTAKEAAIYDVDKGRLFTSSGCNMNNDSKNNPCFQGDIIGDWREEIVVRHGTGLRVYTTGIGTTYSMPSLWFDHQYRQAMVWQMMAYNQPPHLSYFLGQLEGITVAPPALTNTGRTEVANGGTISTTTAHLMMAETNDMTVSVADGAKPYMLTVNTPSWVQGTDVDGTTATKVKTNGNVGVTNLPEITTTTYTHTLTGGAFAGSMRLVKQGDGTLVLPNVVETYTGETSVWGGTLQFDGTLQTSALWLNRFARLVSNGGTFGGGITADYGSRIIPGGADNKGSITTTALTLNHGARLVLDVYASTMDADQINTAKLTIATKSDEAWTSSGVEYLKPVIEIVPQGGVLPDGIYDLGTVGTVTGSIGDIVIEGTGAAGTPRLELSDGHLWLVIGSPVVVLLDETNITAPSATAGTADVNVVRTISANQWSTLCLPISLTAAQWKAAFGSDAEVRPLSTFTKDADGLKVIFGDAVTGDLAKNTPYIIRTKQAVTSFTVRTSVEPAEAKTSILDGTSQEVGYFMGNYKAGTLVPDGCFFLSDNAFFYSKGLTSIKAFRGYFWHKDATGAKAPLLVVGNEVITGIDAAERDSAADAEKFDMQGRRVAAPRKGVIYIDRNGKKTVKK
ncbi:MAG: autotransporter-associated beta strand repeat-containing protein [Prevotella sp.]|nr:autotransporter-associated beta strand repeat-containing protein [Prevotella sp.]